VCEPGRGELVGGVVESAPRTHQGLVSARGIGSGVFRGEVFLRAVRVVIMPRHTPYEEPWLLEKTRRVCEPGRGELVGGVVKPAPRTHQGLVTGWGFGSGVFRGGVFLRAAQVVIGPRHTPYEEAWLLEKTRRVCEPGRGELVGGVVKSAPRTHQGLVTGWGIGSGVFRGGMFSRAEGVVIGPRHTPYEEPRQNILRAAQVVIGPRHTPYEEAKQGCFAWCQA
jgi:hypothetical protein